MQRIIQRKSQAGTLSAAAVGERPGVTAARAAPAPALLRVRDLSVEFHSTRRQVRAVDGVSLSVGSGEIVALVGESGCGKSTTAMALMRLLPRRVGRIAGGSVEFDGRDLLALPENEMRKLRGDSIGMIFQEPMTSLNPAHQVGVQIMETILVHEDVGRARARERALQLLADVGIADAERRFAQYPHQLSGGMRQRVLIAIALACNPKLLIADEPTTALDVTVQAQILELIRDLVRRHGISLLIITHNLGIVARYVDTVNIMYAGRIVESGPVEQIFHDPKHAYTRGLIGSVPRMDRSRAQRLNTIEGMPPDLGRLSGGCRFAPRCSLRTSVCDVEPVLAEVGPSHLAACWHSDRVPFIDAGKTEMRRADARGSVAGRLEVADVTKRFAMAGGAGVKAIDGVSFRIEPGETLGLVGESGCGKSTIGRTIMGLVEPTSGTISLDGEVIRRRGSGSAKTHARKLQMVFQDPQSSLNPRMTVGQIVSEPIRVHRLQDDLGRGAVERRVGELLETTGLPAGTAERYPHQLSGGQRQRVGIARALAMQPRFIVLDEPVSALDVSVQGQIVNLLDDLQQRLGLGYLFIAHDLAVVRHLAHRIAVMYLGRIMETGDADAVCADPIHPYTRALIEAAPTPDPVVEKTRRTGALHGELPSPLSPPSGCVFRTRCPWASEECARTVPVLREVKPERFAACIKV